MSLKISNSYKSGWIGTNKIYIGRASKKLNLQKSILANTFMNYKQRLISLIEQVTSALEKEPHSPELMSLIAALKYHQLHLDSIEKTILKIERDFPQFEKKETDVDLSEWNGLPQMISHIEDDEKERQLQKMREERMRKIIEGRQAEDEVRREQQSQKNLQKSLWRH
jgi:hypothetical protein